MKAKNKTSKQRKVSQETRKVGEEIKIYFCPKCKSKEVSPLLTYINVYGGIPSWKCEKCGYSGVGFPILVIDKEKLRKQEKKK